MTKLTDLQLVLLTTACQRDDGSLLTGLARSHAMRMARLQFLAPDIVTAIPEGRQPVELNTRALMRVSELPIAWTDQRRMLGFS